MVINKVHLEYIKREVSNSIDYIDNQNAAETESDSFIYETQVKSESVESSIPSGAAEENENPTYEQQIEKRTTQPGAISHQHSRQITGYQLRIENNFTDMISKIPSKYPKRVPEIIPQGPLKESSVQTDPMPFGPPVNSSFLLGDLRPWGKPATTLPKKGVGLFKHRNVSKILS